MSKFSTVFRDFLAHFFHISWFWPSWKMFFIEICDFYNKKISARSKWGFSVNCTCFLENQFQEPVFLKKNSFIFSISIIFLLFDFKKITAVKMCFFMFFIIYFSKNCSKLFFLLLVLKVYLKKTDFFGKSGEKTVLLEKNCFPVIFEIWFGPSLFVVSEVSV